MSFLRLVKLSRCTLASAIRAADPPGRDCGLVLGQPLGFLLGGIADPSGFHYRMVGRTFKDIWLPADFCPQCSVLILVHRLLPAELSRMGGCEAQASDPPRTAPFLLA